MKCPKCGGRAKYIVSRKQHWRGKSSKGRKPRTDFRVKCVKCKYEFNAREVYGDFVVSEVKQKIEKKQIIKMKYDEED